MALSIDHAGFKSYFTTGSKPSQAQFQALIDAVALVDAASWQVVYKDGASYVTGQIVKTVKLDIPSAEVLQLFTTPKAFGITVPSGYYVQPISCQMKATYAGIPYATNVDLEVGFLGVKPIFIDTVLGFSSNAFVHLDFNDSGAMTAASDMVVSVNAGNPTAGTSDISIYLTYALIEI